MCRAITGEKPPVAPDRMDVDEFHWLRHRNPGGYSAAFLGAVDWALQFDPTNRPQQIGEMRPYLEGDFDQSPARLQEEPKTNDAEQSFQPEELPPEDIQTSPRQTGHARHRKYSLIAAAVVIALIGSLVVINETRKQAQRERITQEIREAATTGDRAAQFVTGREEQRGYAIIDSQSADVVIEKSVSTTPEIINETNSNEVTFEKTISDNTIEISSKGKQSIIMNAGRIIVRVPANYDIHAKGMSSDFTVNGFASDVLNISTMSGDIKSSAVGFRRSKFKTMSGDIRVHSAIAAGSHEFEAMSGDVVVILGSNSATKVFAKSEKSSASINSRNTKAFPLEEVVGAGTATVHATAISGDVDCQY